jgi:hypothetical protein
MPCRDLEVGDTTSKTLESKPPPWRQGGDEGAGVGAPAWFACWPATEAAWAITSS